MGDQVSVPVRPKPKEQDLPRPLPEGVLASNDPVYDCIVYVIYCSVHGNIAVTNAVKCKCVWLPFIAMPEGQTWMKASQDGVEVLIGRNDPEMEADDAERISPVYQMNYLQIFRLHLPSNKVVLRLSRFIKLEKNPAFECCRNTDRVNWLSVADVLNNRMTKVWGPELHDLVAMVLPQPLPIPQIVQEFTSRNALYYLYLNGSAQQELLASAKLTDNHVYEIYTDFAEHCYPSFNMCEESLRVYLLKYGIALDHIRLSRLFNAFRMSHERRSFVDFHEFLIGLVAMEPNCSNKLEARTRFIFR